MVTCINMHNIFIVLVFFHTIICVYLLLPYFPVSAYVVGVFCCVSYACLLSFYCRTTWVVCLCLLLMWAQEIFMTRGHHGNPGQKRSFGVQATMQTTKFPHAVDILFFFTTQPRFRSRNPSWPSSLGLVQCPGCCVCRGETRVAFRQSVKPPTLRVSRGTSLLIAS